MDTSELIGKRLKALRYALGYCDDQTGFAEKLGILSQAWNNYELGRRRPNLDQAAIIRRKTGVTYDWIYEGLWSSLPFDLADKLRKALDDLENQQSA